MNNPGFEANLLSYSQTRKITHAKFFFRIFSEGWPQIILVTTILDIKSSITRVNTLQYCGISDGNYFSDTIKDESVMLVSSKLLEKSQVHKPLHSRIPSCSVIYSVTSTPITWMVLVMYSYHHEQMRTPNHCKMQHSTHPHV